MSYSPLLLLPSEYVADATAAIYKARHRVSLVCMMVIDDEATDEFIDSLCEAAARGIQVDVAADVFTFGELSGHFHPAGYYSKFSKRTREMTKRFKKSGVNFNWLGKFTLTPFSGRTHTKWCVVDDTIYSFGGVNLYDGGIKNVDYMFKVNDPEIANIIAGEYPRLIRADHGHFANRSRSLPTKIGALHLDGGLPFESVIYRRACALTKESEKVLFVSQYSPTGRLSRLLKKSDSKLFFNQPKKVTNLNRIVIKLSALFSGNKTLYTRDQYLHAKFIIFYLKNGNRVALTGSHNFASGGVILGTREVALETKDAAIIDQLETFFKKHVA